MLLPSAPTRRQRVVHIPAFNAASLLPILRPPLRSPIPRAPPTSTVMVAAPPPHFPLRMRNTTSAPSRYLRPVPDPKPHEVPPCGRGRNSRRRVREAEHFRRYLYLRKQLKPWSDQFRAKHGRTPSLIDVHASDVPGLLDRFVEYLEALEALRVEA